MRIALVAKDARKAFLLRRLQEEGCDVLLLTKKVVPENLVPTISDPEELEKWKPDIALFVDTGGGLFAKHLQDKGIKVVGSGLLHDHLDKDPEYASVLASRVKVPVVDVDNRGVYLYLAGFFTRRGFVGPAYSYAVDRGLLPGGKTEEAVVMYAIPDGAKIVEKTFKKLEKLFSAFNYTGFILLYIQVDPESGEPNIRKIKVHLPDCFWPAFLAGLRQPLYRLLEGLADNCRFRVKYTRDFACAVKVSIPPYPWIKFPWLSGAEAEQAYNLLIKGSIGKKVRFNEPDNYPLQIAQSNGEYITTGPEVAYSTTVGDIYDLPFIIAAQVASLRIKSPQWHQSPGRSLVVGLSYCEKSNSLQKLPKKDKKSRRRVLVNES